MVRIGTAGWAIPRTLRDRFAGDGTRLERYARVFPCVEINSSFYRPHRRATYERWAASVPAAFRFAVKLPKEISHTRRLRDAEEPLDRFLDESAGLGEKRGVILLQLPPSFAFEASVAEAFFALLRRRCDDDIACEPRHPSWFEPAAGALLHANRVARAAADPAVVPEAAVPGGWDGLVYVRLHGAPRTYYSSYETEQLGAIATCIRRRASDGDVWCIFDNTALDAAASNALSLRAAFA